jgi:hypothetical protein
VKTDDRATRQRNEAEGDEAKVVRLSDWLAPDDELVPFGPRAHANTATRESAERRTDPDSSPEAAAASGFWDGDTSVHTAVPGPGIFDEPADQAANRHRHRRAALVWHPALPPLHPLRWASRAREEFGELAERIPWRWAAAGVACVALALTVLVVTFSGGSPGRHETAAEASVGDAPRAELRETLDELGTATGAAAATDLRPLPSVDAAVRTIGAATTKQARALQAHHRRRAAVASVSHASSSAMGSVEAPATTSAPPTTGGGGSSSGAGSSSGSQKQPAFGAAGSLGPGSSPNG